MIFETLDALKIPFTIEYTDKIVTDLMRIAECKPFFNENLSKPLQVCLLRNAKVRAITYSNQIEGNTLSEAEVRKLIQQKKSKLSDRETLEIQNYSDALNYAEKMAQGPRPIRIADFFDLQRLITEGLLQSDHIGKLRTIQVAIVNSKTNEKIDSCPEPHHLKMAIDDLWRWMDYTKNMNPFLRAFAFHFISVAIHPFVDGNGRTSRLMQHLLLLQSGENIVRYVPSETVIMNYRENYYNAIRQTKKLQKLTPILEFLTFCFAEAAERITIEAKHLIKETELKPAIRQAKILALFKKKKELKTGDIVLFFPQVPRRTLERDMEVLCLEKKIKAIGNKKARVYQLG